MKRGAQTGAVFLPSFAQLARDTTLCPVLPRRESDGFEVDDSRFPLVVLWFPTAVLSTPEAAIDAHLLELSRLEGRGPFVLVSDTSGAHPQDAVSRRRFFEGVRAFNERARGDLLAEALVVDSLAVRGVVTAYRWFVPASDYSTKVFNQLEGAVSWAESFLP